MQNIISKYDLKQGKKIGELVGRLMETVKLSCMLILSSIHAHRGQNRQNMSHKTCRSTSY